MIVFIQKQINLLFLSIYLLVIRFLANVLPVYMRSV